MVKKKILIAISILVLVLVGATMGGGYYLLDYALRPQHRGKDIEGSWRAMKESYPHIAPWMDSLRQHKALRDTFITASDGTRLHAYYMRAARPSKYTALIVHGYTDNAIRMLHIGYLYSKELNYNILLPDSRDTGLSGGDAIQMGWGDLNDLSHWADCASYLFGFAPIVVHGISMGAAATMMLSGDELVSPEIRCYVEDCGYTSVWDQFERELKVQFHLPSWPLLYMASGWCKVKYMWSFKEASALESVKRCIEPMLFIHGAADDYVPTYMVKELYEAKRGPKELWIVPGAGHALSYKLHPEEYTERVRRFVGKYNRMPKIMHYNWRALPR